MAVEQILSVEYIWFSVFVKYCTLFQREVVFFDWSIWELQNQILPGFFFFVKINSKKLKQVKSHKKKITESPKNRAKRFVAAPKERSKHAIWHIFFRTSRKKQVIPLCSSHRHPQKQVISFSWNFEVCKMMGKARYLAWMSYFQVESPLILGKTWKLSKKEAFC